MAVLYQVVEQGRQSALVCENTDGVTDLHALLAQAAANMKHTGGGFAEALSRAGTELGVPFRQVLADEADALSHDLGHGGTAEQRICFQRRGHRLSAARIGGRPAGNGRGQRTPHCAAALQAGRGNQHDDECAGGRYGDQRGGSPAASRQMCPGGQADQRQYLPQGRGEIPKGAGIGGD